MADKSAGAGTPDYEVAAEIAGIIADEAGDRLRYEQDGQGTDIPLAVNTVYRGTDVASIQLDDGRVAIVTVSVMRADLAAAQLAELDEAGPDAVATVRGTCRCKGRGGHTNPECPWYGTDEGI